MSEIVRTKVRVSARTRRGAEQAASALRESVGAARIWFGRPTPGPRRAGGWCWVIYGVFEFAGPAPLTLPSWSTRRDRKSSSRTPSWKCSRTRCSASRPRAT